jgi:hypothetical protein
MNCYYAAALALVGWYLIAPPLIDNDPARLVADAPISKWQVIASFDTALACENMRVPLVESKNPYDDPLSKKNSEIRSRRMFCISTDDPRLKGN